MARQDGLKPRWIAELEASLGVRTTFVVGGAVHDLQMEVDQPSGTCICVSLDEQLYIWLMEHGYSRVVFYNRVEGFHNRLDPSMIEQLSIPGENPNPTECTLECASVVINQLLTQETISTAVVFDLATSAFAGPETRVPEERDALARLLLASEHMGYITSERCDNLLFIIADKANDVPAWFYVGNPAARVLNIGHPSREQRLYYVNAHAAAALSGYAELSSEEADKVLEQFANLSEGMSVRELKGFFDRAELRGDVDVENLRGALDAFRYGETADYWERLDGAAIARAKRLMCERIKGQDAAIDKAVALLYRAAAGISLTASSSSSSKPKGVLFLAGPTGTGKTELAKAITEAVFSDEGHMVRFDMSEFSEQHASQRLFGAPPGYVGYEAGGELTNAVRERPFTVLLFDEIEKAHPSILDKFLQVLDDGRLTDSHGETVYFGQSLIVFTSNLGMTLTDPLTQEVKGIVTRETFDSREAFHEYVRSSIALNCRPEFRNRIGDGVVVFDFIDEPIAREIAAEKLSSFGTRLARDRGLEVLLSPELVCEVIDLACEKLDMGGRGIVNRLQSVFVDPLARALVDVGALRDVRVCAIDRKDGALTVSTLIPKDAISLANVAVYAKEQGLAKPS